MRYKCAAARGVSAHGRGVCLDPTHYDALYKRIERAAQGAWTATGDLQEVARAMELTCMVELGLNTAELDEIVAALQPLMGLAALKYRDRVW